MRKPGSRDRSPARVVIPHRHAWLWEPLEARPDFALRAMFGAKAVYLDGRLVAAFMAKEEPWRGMLVATSREHHAALRAEFPVLAPHRVLPKWLYLPEADEAFETVAEKLMRLAAAGDPRIGVIPPPKKGKAVAARRRRNSVSFQETRAIGKPMNNREG
jgi:hypothetical protein